MDGIVIALLGLAEALIAAGLGAWGTYAAAKKNSEAQFNRMMAELDKHNALQDERIRTLTDRVEKHNSVIERTYKLEARVGALEAK